MSLVTSLARFGSALSASVLWGLAVGGCADSNGGTILASHAISLVVLGTPALAAGYIRDVSWGEACVGIVGLVAGGFSFPAYVHMYDVFVSSRMINLVWTLSLASAVLGIAGSRRCSSAETLSRSKHLIVGLFGVCFGVACIWLSNGDEEGFGVHVWSPTEVTRGECITRCHGMRVNCSEVQPVHDLGVSYQVTAEDERAASGCAQALVRGSGHHWMCAAHPLPSEACSRVYDSGP